MIYIDPPYNTGSDGFLYQDDRKFTVKEMQQLAGIDEEKAKRILDFTQAKSNSHSAWLTFMYPRLYIAYQLLKDEGVIFISIDDNEVAQLRLLMDEIFGEENFVASLIWNTGRKSTAKLVATNHEYCLIYAKYISKQSAEEVKNGNGEDEINGKLWREKKMGLEPIYAKYEELKKEFGMEFDKISRGLKKYFDSLSDDNPTKAHDHYCFADHRGIYFPDNTAAPDKPETRSHKPLIHPVTKKPTAVPELGWRYNDVTLKKLVDEDRIHFGVNESTVPNKKTYLQDTEFSVPSSVFYRDARGAKKRLKALFGGVDVFTFPKDEEIIKKLIRFCVIDGDIVIDFFAGSGTTGEAIIQLNSEDGSNRKYLLVQLPEPLNPKKDKVTYEFVKSELGIEEPTIFEITKERLIRAATKTKEGNINKKITEKVKKIKSLESKLDFDEKEVKIKQLKSEIKSLKILSFLCNARAISIVISLLPFRYSLIRDVLVSSSKARSFCLSLFSNMRSSITSFKDGVPIG